MNGSTNDNEPASAIVDTAVDVVIAPESEPVSAIDVAFGSEGVGRGVSAGKS